MNKLTSSKNSSIILLLTLIVSILFALYYYLLLPRLNEVEAKESHVSQIQQEISSVKEQLAQLDKEQGQPTINVLALRQKLPTTRAVEKIILDLAEIEEVTGTRIKSLTVQNDDAAVSQSDVSQDLNLLEQAEEEVNGEQDNKITSSPISSISKDSLPSNLKLITFILEVGALDFNSLESFLQEIEQLQRVMKTDTIEFKLPGEQDQLEKDTDLTLQATVQVTTFYYEGE
ncbi:MAG TPA: hypothetical protein DEB37_01265 [Lysinibacillus sp.]|uniref:hypothetical protein n=1 Tax=Lysinibacillus TaxID=400634 RepID=UPI000887E440|nr:MULTISPECIES: hypothetical protein [unclassified Lysinibacillus]MEE3807159.1 hypothetical protein [Lysinibacillus fusiformis]HBT70934.1 hypothetical protein [Lysinibacillus sp.]SCX89237.1 hypothetical protein SAMN02787078_00434 [Lysinibacillus sp. SG9]SDB05887.1 hypothetical protein SAMN02787079_00433 [Lysinibacillus sp. TC-37]SFS36622.1 hypothetical protein SAMN02787087_00438 [Lysinibacillus sp. SG55]